MFDLNNLIGKKVYMRKEYGKWFMVDFSEVEKALENIVNLSTSQYHVVEEPKALMESNRKETD